LSSWTAIENVGNEDNTHQQITLNSVNMSNEVQNCLSSNYLLKTEHTYIPWIHKFVRTTVGCGMSHKDTKHMDKCCCKKTKTTQKQNDEM